VTSIDRRPTDPLGQARLALTVIRNPPHGDLVFDGGASILSQLRSWYPELVERFGDAVLLVAARRAVGGLRDEICGHCLAAAVARGLDQDAPPVSRATIELLGRPCHRHTTTGAHSVQPTHFAAMVAAVPPGAPAGVWKLLRERLAQDPDGLTLPTISRDPVHPDLR
jgi:hypothetical protein